MTAAARPDPGSQPRQSRAEARAQTRARLLDAAAKTFAEKGFDGATVDEIAAAAGFTIGALYSNFRNKEALFLELLDTRGGDRLSRAAELVRSHDLDLASSAADLGELLTEVADHDAEFAPLQAEFWLYAVRNPAALATMTEALAGSRALLRSLVGTVVAQRGIPADAPEVDHLATVVDALFGGLARQRRLAPDTVPDQLFGEALVWLLDGLCAQQGDTPRDI